MGGRARLGGALKIDIVSPVLAGEPDEPQAGRRGPWARPGRPLDEPK